MLGIKLDSLAKKIAAILIILTALGALSKGIYTAVVSYQEYTELLQRVYELEKKEYPVIDVKKIENRLSEIELGINKIDSSRVIFTNNFSVGYRCDKNGKKYFRSWDGHTYNVYPDIEFSDENQKYYYYIKDNGKKVYCFSE